MKSLKRLSRRDFLKLSIAVALALVLAACSPAPTPTPTPTAAPTATHTPLPTATLLPTATPTAAPTATPEATKTPTPEPTIPLEGVSIHYPLQTLVIKAYEKFIPEFNIDNPVTPKQLKYEVKTNLNDPNKTLIVFGRDPKTGDIILATRMDQQTKELQWHVAGLRDLADAVGIRIGTSPSPFYPSETIAAHNRIIFQEFNRAGMEQYFMMNQIAPEGQPNFAAAKNAVNLAKADGMTTGVNAILYGKSDFETTFLKKYWQLAEQSGFIAAINNLSYDEALKINADPVYGQKKLEDIIDGLSDPKMREEIRQARKELREYIVKYVKTVVGEFRGEIDVWGMINEFDINPKSTWDPYFWLIGPDYPDLVSKAAREADPTILIMLMNEEVSLDNNETDWSYMITYPVVKRLDGLINAVGDQGHEDASQPFDWEKRLALLKKFGLSIIITERDVDLRDTPGNDDERFKLQAKIYADSFRSALNNGVKIYNFWECFGDKDSWLERLNPPLSSPKADPTLFFDDGTPKPAYFAVRKVLLEKLDQK